MSSVRNLFGVLALTLFVSVLSITSFAQDGQQGEQQTQQQDQQSTDNTPPNYQIRHHAIKVLDLQKQEGSNFKLFKKKCSPDDDDGKIESIAGSPPLVVDDGGTPGCNGWEINITFDGDLTPGEHDYEIPLFDINYGIGENIQLKFEVPILSQNGPDGSLRGLGNSEFGIKWRFYDNEQKNRSFAVYPQVEFNNPGSNSVQRGLVESGTEIKLLNIFNNQIGTIHGADLNMTTNFSYNVVQQSTNPDTISGGVGLAIPIFNKVAIMGETAFERDVKVNPETARKDSLVVVNVGFIRPVTNHFQIYGSVGRSARTDTDGNFHTYFVTGIRVIVPPKVKKSK